VTREFLEQGAAGTAALLPLLALLTLAKPRPGTTDILTMAARCARALGRREHVDGLAQVAGRGGGSQIVRAARDLHDALCDL
jgi:hypothetical protein